MGCAGACLLLVVAMLAWGYITTRRIQSYSATVTAEKVKQDLAPIPIYPGAQFNRTMTGATVGAMRAIPGINRLFKGGGCFDTTDSPQKVLDWYSRALPKLGYTQTTTSTLPGGAQQVQYTNGLENVVLQPQIQGGKTILSIQRVGKAGSPG
jgi:hypothetical protein